jgi:signal recognition particle GTPase
MNNEYYDAQGNIDELKLFIKSEGNVSEQLANTAMVEQMMNKMNTFLATLTMQEKETIKRIKESNKNRSIQDRLVG